MLLFAPAFAAELHLSDVEALRDAVAMAQPGDVLVLDAGTYTVDRTLTLDAAGTAEAPITLRGEGATLRSEVVEAIKIRAPFWRIEDLRMEGACPSDDDCEHALHLVGAADGVVVQGCTLVDFNAQIKSNGEPIDGVYAWPDDVQIRGNAFFDTRPRQTSNPVTKLDVVGGQRWLVEANRFADFQKDGGDTVSYAAFLKGNSKDGVFARNLVVCSQAFEGGVRVGLSLGGGGTSPDSLCEDGTCSPEHQRGVLRNNLIVGCSDVGIYLNEAAETQVLHNTLYATSGIDVRYLASTATVDGNVLDGRIRARDEGTLTLGVNLESFDLTTAFADPAALDFTLVSDAGLRDAGSAALADDYCGLPRDARPDLGALEYTSAAPCDTRVTWPEVGDSPVDSPSDSVPDSEVGVEDGKCGCAAGPARPLFPLAGVLMLLRRRR